MPHHTRQHLVDKYNRLGHAVKHSRACRIAFKLGEEIVEHEFPFVGLIIDGVEMVEEVYELLEVEEEIAHLKSIIECLEENADSDSDGLEAKELLEHARKRRHDAERGLLVDGVEFGVAIL